MSLVAIVGRPNVGKSTLFNKIIGSRKALVSDMPGVTRDRHYATADWCGVSFTLVDTGGLSFDETDAVEAKVHEQSIVALESADVVICLFDGREGLHHLDREIVNIFRKNAKKVVYGINKIDTEGQASLASDFAELGINAIPFSADHSVGLDEVLDAVIAHLPKTGEHEVAPRGEGIKIALVGRPNTGKSTIINKLANENRVVAHNMPGTTRDSIDVYITLKDKNYIFVDTAGVKRKGKTHEAIDKFSTLKSLHTIEDADIVFIVADDAEDGFTRQDITLAAHSFGLYKPTAVLINKWDIIKPKKKMSEKDYIEEVRYRLKDLRDIPVFCVSGKTGMNLNQIFRMAEKLSATKFKRIPTAELNRFFEHLVDSHPVPDYKGKQVKLKYIAQVDVNPPVFTVFTNQPKGVKAFYKKYLMKGLRSLLGGEVIPIVVKYR